MGGNKSVVSVSPVLCVPSLGISKIRLHASPGVLTNLQRRQEAGGRCDGPFSGCTHGGSALPWEGRGSPGKFARSPSRLCFDSPAAPRGSAPRRRPRGRGRERARVHTHAHARERASLPPPRTKPSATAPDLVHWYPHPPSPACLGPRPSTGGLRPRALATLAPRTPCSSKPEAGAVRSPSGAPSPLLPPPCPSFPASAPGPARLPVSRTSRCPAQSPCALPVPVHLLPGRPRTCSGLRFRCAWPAPRSLPAVPSSLAVFPLRTPEPPMTVPRGTPAPPPPPFPWAFPMRTTHRPWHHSV